MEIRLPDYQHCIANLACSVLKHYGLEPPNATLQEADALLKKQYRNVVVLLLDGLGVNVMERHLAADGFFRRNLRCTYSSTFPPTTVAATTAAMSGLFPNQSSWLGWTGYFPQLDRNIVYFTNVDNDTGEKIEGPHAAFTWLPYRKVTDRVRAAGVEAREIVSWAGSRPQTFDALCTEIESVCAGEGKHYLYAYWEEPDKSMHRLGVGAPTIGEIIAGMERRTEAMAAGLEDALLIVTADHGMIDTHCAVWTDEPALLDCLVRPPSMDSRAANLFVKQGMEQRFERAFQKRFGHEFRLLTRDEVLRRGLLGQGNNHPLLSGMLGDYLAVAVGGTTLRMKDKGYIGEHAGLTAEEMTIPLIAIEKA